MKNTINYLLITLSLTCLPSSAWADEISGTISFVKKPSFTGVLYVADEKGSIKKPNIDQKDKAFTTSIAVGSANDVISFKNSDTFDHNIYASDRKQNVKFDVGLMTPNNETNLNMDWAQDSLVRIGCKIHPKMRSYIANINSDYFHAFEFEKKVKEYTFSISDVPSDKHQVVLLMPKYKPQTIEIKKGESKTVEIKRKGKVKGTIAITRQ